MRKLKLDADTLQVQSFQTHPGATPAAGTVRGHVVSPNCSIIDDCVTYWEETCGGCANTSPRPSCFDCSWDEPCATVQCD
jgi:hypothetical protein